MNIKEKAKEFAILAHKDQVRKSDKEKEKTRQKRGVFCE